MNDFCSLSELPECQLPLAMRTDVIDQALAMAMHPVYYNKTGTLSAGIILFLTQSPEAHAYIARKEIIQNMLEICELKQKKIIGQSSQRDKEAVNALK